MGSRLILYDTSNFRDYPVGGQVTSIKNFLRFVSESYSEKLEHVLLVGVTTQLSELGKIIKIETVGYPVHFLAVALASTDLSNIKSSLRLEYVKGLLKYRKLIALNKGDCNYIHTPEAFAAVRLICHKANCHIFSHGTYFDMYQRVRFFKKNPFVRKAFQNYLIRVLKKANSVFVLDFETLKSYEQYNKNIIKAGNSIVCEAYKERSLKDIEPIKLIYAGRLSVVKNLGPMLEAVKSYKRDVSLLILGDGEEYVSLKKLGNEKIHFMGAVSPEEVKDHMKSANILIMNSTFEGIPMTILEAMSVGLPVITTDVGGIKEVLEYGVDSEKTDGTVESIHSAMDKILENYAKYAVNAYNHSKQFDYSVVNKTVFNVLNKQLQW